MPQLELNDAEIERIAQRAAAIVIEKVQLEIGKSAVRAFLYVVGAAMVALVAYLTAKGRL
jgi:hypothetical protein